MPSSSTTLVLFFEEITGQDQELMRTDESKNSVIISTLKISLFRVLFREMETAKHLLGDWKSHWWKIHVDPRSRSRRVQVTHGEAPTLHETMPTSLKQPARARIRIKTIRDVLTPLAGSTGRNHYGVPSIW